MKKTVKKITSFRLTLDEKDQVKPVIILIILSVSAGAVIAMAVNK